MVTTFKWLRVKKTVLVSMGKNVRFSTILVFKITILLGGGVGVEDKQILKHITL